jgi:two-component system sensor histidine kinase DegS
VVSRHRKGAPIWLSVWQYRFVCACKECYLTFLIDITKEKLAQQDQQEKERALAQLRELHDQDREWIACDIHDGVVQDMAGALMHLEAARRAVANGRPDAVERLGKVVQYLRDGINEARRLIDGVRPPGLDRQDLTLALGKLVAKVTDSSRIPIEFIGEEEGLQLDPTVETAIYRLVQESLNNVWKHSGASRARVELTRTASGVRLIVRDWGQGFDPEKVTAERFGLSGMQQRTRLAGGTFSLKSAPGKGCKIVAEFPQQAALAPRMSKPG